AVVCPNAIEDKTFEAYCARFPSSYCESPKRVGQIRVGYVGSMSHVGDVATIVKPLQKVMDERPQVRAVFYGQDLRGLFARQYWSRMSFGGATAARATENQMPSLYGQSLCLAITRHWPILISTLVWLRLNATSSIGRSRT